MRIKRVTIFILIYIILSVFKTSAQVVYENINTGVYEYLDRMSQKGFIKYQDLIKPLNRSYLFNKLEELKLVDTALSKVEKLELEFYLREYIQSNEKKGDTIKIMVFKKNYSPVFFSAKSGNSYLNISPVIQFSNNQYSGNNYLQKAWCTNIWGRIGKNIGFNISFRDVNENRTDLSNDSVLNDASTGYVLLTQNLTKTKTLNYSEYRASVGYEWKNGFVSIGQDNLTWG